MITPPWIKVRYDLHKVRETVELAAQLGINPYQAVGHLVAFWSWVDAEMQDGAIKGCQHEAVIDSIAGMQGFAAAMVNVGWLVLDGEKVYIPNWDRFLGAAAKKRSLNTKRQQQLRNRPR